MLETGVGLGIPVGVGVAAIAGASVGVGKGAGVGIGSVVEVGIGMEDGMGVAAVPQAIAATISSPMGRNRIALPLMNKSTFFPPVRVELGMPKSTGQHSNSSMVWHMAVQHYLPTDLQSGTS